MSNLKEESSHLLEGLEEQTFLRRNLSQLRDATAKLRNKSVVQEKGPKVYKSLADIGIDPDQPLIDSLNVKKSLNQSLQPLEATDIDGFIRNQYQNTIITAIEDAKNQTAKCLERSSRIKMEKEWEKSKKEILEELGYRTIGWDSIINTQNSYSDGMMPKIKCYLSVIENLAKKKINGKNLAEAFINAYQRIPTQDSRRSEIRDCWKMIYMFLIPFGGLQKNYFNLGLTEPNKVKITLNSQAKKFLEEQYFSVIEQFVSKFQLQRREPSDLDTIRSYVSNQITTSRMKLDKNWATIYYCVRCGKLSEAIQIAKKLQGEGEFVGFLKCYAKFGQLSEQLLHDIKENHMSRSTRGIDLDPALQALYVALGQVKIPVKNITSVISTTQDFMWLKLSSINETSENNLTKLQDDLKKWGPAHFNPKGTNPLLYFQVLLLSQQFEEAIRYLDSFPLYKIESIHFGCTLFYYGLLEVVENTEKIRVGFDFEKLLSQFIRQFGSIDPAKFSLYYFLLPEERLISSMVKFICDTRQLDMLGRIQPDGSKTECVMDLLDEDIANKIIASVAEEFNTAENFVESIRLFDLAGKHSKVLDIVNHQLALVLSKPGKERNRTAEIAQNVYQQYSRGGNDSILENFRLQKQTQTFKKMQYLLQFFECIQSNPQRLQDALRIQQELNIIPFRNEDIQEKVNEFNSLDECIKRNFSAILLSTMKILVLLHGQKSLSNEQQKIKHIARCLATFSGMIPYQMPGNENQEFISLQVKIS